MQGFPRNFRKSGHGRFWPAYLLLALLWFGANNVRNNRTPENPENICAVFADKSGWYKAAEKSEERWGTPKHVQMSIMRQESSFIFNAQPPRTKLMGIIPWKRKSDAYGYAQALDKTWTRYKKDTGRESANRDDFEDAIDFVGWYTNLSNKSEGISKWDSYNQYLAYHEGQAGWRRGSFQNKTWLKKTAKRVDLRARKWWAQLQSCEDELNSGWWVFGG